MAANPNLNFFPKAVPGGPPNTWSPEMTRVLLDVMDRHIPIEGEGRSTKLLHIAKEVSLAIKKLPASKRNDLDDNAIKRKMEKFTRHTVDGKSPYLFPVLGRKLLNFRRLPQGILSPVEYQAWVEERRAKKTNQNRKQPPTLQQPGVVDSKADEEGETPNESEDKKAIRSGLKDKILQRGLSSLMQETIPPAAIIRELNAIYEQISNTVRDRIEEAGLDKEYPVLDLLRPASPRWDGILETITGSKRPLFEPGLAYITQAQRHNTITLGNFVSSVIGAAVMRWTLEPHPLGDLLGRGYQTLLDAITQLDEQGATLLAEDACAKLLREDVRPKIPEKAEALAREVDGLLASYLVPHRHNKADGGRTVARPVTRSNQDPDADQSAPRKKVRLGEPEWVQEWQSELTKIFKMALNLRVSLEIKASGKFRFEFPVPGDPWIAGFGGGREIEKYVFYGIFPRVEGSFQDIRGGEWSEWQVLLEAVVDFDQEGIVDARHGEQEVVQASEEDDETATQISDLSNLSDEEEGLSDEEQGERDPTFQIPDSKRKKGGMKYEKKTGSKYGKKRKGPSK